VAQRDDTGHVIPSEGLRELLTLSRSEADEVVRQVREGRAFKADRARYRERFLDFVRDAWHRVEPRTFVPGRHVEVLCDWLQTYFDEHSGEQGVVNVPFGTGKSLICSVLFPCWVWAARDQGHRFLCTSYSDDAVKRDSMRARGLVESAWWRERWPAIALRESGAALKVEDWSLTTGGYRISVPLSGQITSRHCDTAVVDDPLKVDDARLDGAVLSKTQRILDDTLGSRFLSPSTSHRLLVMQRLHAVDPAGVAIGKGAHKLVLPMRYESEHPDVDPLDWRTVDGELLCPAYRSEADVAALESGPTALTPYAQAGQLQQRPYPEGGGMFKLDDFRFYKALPRGALDGGQWCMALDSKFKKTESGAFACITVWCLYEAKFFLVAVWRERAGLLATVAAMRQLATAWPRAHTKIVEEAANGASVCELLEGNLPGIKRVKPEGGKEARAHALSAYVETHDVLLPEADPLTIAFKAEAEGFPNGATADQIDSSAHAVNHLAGKSTSRYKAGVARMKAGLRRVG